MLAFDAGTQALLAKGTSLKHSKTRSKYMRVAEARLLLDDSSAAAARALEEYLAIEKHGIRALREASDRPAGSAESEDSDQGERIETGGVADGADLEYAIPAAQAADELPKAPPVRLQTLGFYNIRLRQDKERLKRAVAVAVAVSGTGAAGPSGKKAAAKAAAKALAVTELKQHVEASRLGMSAAVARRVYIRHYLDVHGEWPASDEDDAVKEEIKDLDSKSSVKWNVVASKQANACVVSAALALDAQLRQWLRKGKLARNVKKNAGALHKANEQVQATRAALERATNDVARAERGAVAQMAANADTLDSEVSLQDASVSPAERSKRVNAKAALALVVALQATMAERVDAQVDPAR